MKDLEEAKMENFEKNKKNFSEENDSKVNRKQVERIKRFLVAMMVLICAMPIYLGLYMVVKLNVLQQETNEVVENVTINYKNTDMVTASGKLTPELTTDYAKLDEDTSDDIDKVSKKETGVLMNSKDYANSYNTVSNNKKVYLTFDDGPSENTAEILDVLASNNVKATFFVVCNPDRSLWPMYKRIVEEGHTLAMHSYTHVYDEIYASQEAFEKDVSDLHEFLYEQTGVDCKFYRFPGGSSNTVSSVDIQDLMAYLDEQGYTYFDWNALSEDAVDPSLTPEELNNNVMGYVRANEGDSVVLMHDIDACENTKDALQSLITTLKSEGYTLRAIDENTTPVQHVTYEGAN